MIKLIIFIELSKSESTALSHAIKNLGLTNYHLANLFGYKPSTIIKKINGSRNFTAEELLTIYDIIGRKEELSFIERYIPEKIKSLETYNSNNPLLSYERIAGRLRRSYQNLSEEKQRHILKSMEDLLK